LRREGRNEAGEPVGQPVIYVLTQNEGKFREFLELGKTHGVVLKQLPSPKVEVQLRSLEDIATYAASVALVEWRVPLFVEDAGLFIEALKGFPGPYSSYVYKTLGVDGILKLMEGVRDRRAYFKSVIALAIPGEGVRIFTGVVKGGIALEARGTGGFGFDPIFIAEGMDRTFAELSISEKNRLSHRGKAFASMVKWLRTAFKSRIS